MHINIEGKLNQNGFCIKKSSYNNEILNFIKTKFVAIPTGCEDTELEKEKKKFHVFYEDTSYLVLPKFCYKLNFKLDDSITFNDKIYDEIKFVIKKISYKNKKSKFKVTRVPYDYQQIILDFLLKHFKECDKKKIPKGGIIQLDCGAGKTVLAACLAALLGLKVLVVVPQQPILEQWVDEFKENSDAKIGIIQGKKIDIEGKDVVIAMVQSLSLKTYDPSVFSEFGLVIYDEVHHLGARKFSKALQKTSFEYTIGLSATPERQDDTMFVVNWNIGEVLYSMQRKLDYRIWIKRINFDSMNPMFKTTNKWFKGRMSPNTQLTFNNILAVSSRNNLIASIILKLIVLDRKVLILSQSLEHLSKLCIIVDGELSKLKNNGCTKEYKTHVYIGATKKDKREHIKKNGNIIFATIQLVEEGFNVPRLNTIVFASPVSIPTDKETKKLKSTKKLIQAIGRILRKNELDDLSEAPLVIDMSDNLSIYKSWSKKRNMVYEKKGWFVQDYYFTDCKFHDKDKENNDNSSTNSKNLLKNDKVIFKELGDNEFIHRKLIIKKKKFDDEFDIENSLDDTNDFGESTKTEIESKVESKKFDYDF